MAKESNAVNESGISAVDRCKSILSTSRIREEYLNCISHGFGLLLSLIGLGILIPLADSRGEQSHLIGSIIFGVTLILMYGASTIYHGARTPGMRRIFRIIDHISIFLLIAGTYTPVLLLLFPDPQRWTLMISVWTFALVGTFFKLFFTGRYDRISLLLYIAMGWFAVTGFDTLIKATPAAGVGWLISGGLLYTGGIVFYAWERLPYHHAIWHFFVLGGSLCHFMAVFVFLTAI